MFRNQLEKLATGTTVSIVNKGNWLDLPLRYAPYNNKLSTIKKLFNWL